MKNHKLEIECCVSGFMLGCMLGCVLGHVADCMLDYV